MSKLVFDVAVEEVRLEQVGEDARVFAKRDGKFTARSRSFGVW